MEFPTLINWTSTFPFDALLGVNFYFYSNFNRTFCKQTVKILIRHNAVSDIGLHRLPMSHNSKEI